MEASPGKQPDEHKVGIPPAAELEQCPEAIQLLVGEIVREVRGTTRGRRNFNLEFSAMRAIAKETGLDPTNPSNAEALATTNIEGIRAQVQAAVSTSYELTRKKSVKAAPEPKPEPAPTSEPAAPAPEPAPTPEPTPDDPTTPNPPLTQTKIPIEIYNAAETGNTQEILRLIGENPEEGFLRQLMDTLRERFEGTSRRRKTLKTVMTAIEHFFKGKTRSIQEDISPDEAIAHPEQVKSPFTFLRLASHHSAPGKKVELLTIGIDRSTKEGKMGLVRDMLQAKARIHKQNNQPEKVIETLERLLRLQSEEPFQHKDGIRETVLKIEKLKSSGENTRRIKTLQEQLKVFQTEDLVKALTTAIEILLLQERTGADPFDLARTHREIEAIQETLRTTAPNPNPQQEKPTSSAPQTLVIPNTIREVFGKCHAIIKEGRLEEALIFVEAAKKVFQDGDLDNRGLGISTAMGIMENPLTIEFMGKQELLTASHVFEKMREYESAIKCLERLQKMDISANSRRINGERIDCMNRLLEKKYSPPKQTNPQTATATPSSQPANNSLPTRDTAAPSQTSPPPERQADQPTNTPPSQPPSTPDTAAQPNTSSQTSDTAAPSQSQFPPEQEANQPLDTPTPLTFTPPPEKPKKPEEILRENLISWLSRIKAQAKRERWEIRTEKVQKQKGKHGEKHYLVIPKDKREELLRQFSEMESNKSMQALYVVSSTEMGGNKKLEGMIPNLKGQLVDGELVTKGRILDDILKVLVGEEN